MAKKRWIVVPGRGPDGNGAGDGSEGCSGRGRPAIYHCVSRVVDKRFALGPEEKEKFRSLMRRYEKFSGNRVLAYCVMCNHIHLLLEVTPRPLEPLTDGQLLERVGAISSREAVLELRLELREARKNLARGLVSAEFIESIHARYTYRMHDLSEFMKGLMQRFTQWFNGTHKRSGTLWERAFKSVIVEDGEASRMVAAYIDLNPVRAGMVEEPADYRWSSYGEAVGGGLAGDGKRAREGLVRAWTAHQGWSAAGTIVTDRAGNGSRGDGRVPDARSWDGGERIHAAYRALLLAEGSELSEQAVDRVGVKLHRVRRRGVAAGKAREERARLEATGRVAVSQRLRWRVRYFTDGVAIGSRAFVDGVFAANRERFGARRRDGARRMRGDAAALTRSAGLFSLRDLGDKQESSTATL